MGPGAGRHQGRAQAAGTRGRRGLGGCPDGERGHGASHPSPVPSTGGTAACGWHRALHREWVLTTEHEGLRVPRPHVGQAGRSRAGAVAVLPSPGTATAGPACQDLAQGGRRRCCRVPAAGIGLRCPFPLPHGRPHPQQAQPPQPRLAQLLLFPPSAASQTLRAAPRRKPSRAAAAPAGTAGTRPGGAGAGRPGGPAGRWGQR